MALSGALGGYISCLIASQIHWSYIWLTAPAVLPGLSFGLVTAGWLLHRRWIGRGKAAGLVVGSAVAYFAAYWSALYTFAFCGPGMILSTLRLPLFHAGMIAGLVGTALLIASLAAVSADFRSKDWKTLIIIGTAAGGALCLAGIGAKSFDHAGSLANPGDKVFICLWQLLVGGYIGVLLLSAPSSSSRASERGRIALWARRAVLILLLASLIHAAIGFSRGDKERIAASPAASGNSNADLSTPRKAVQAFEDALENNDMDLARSIALGEDQRLIDAKTSHALVRAWSRMEVAKKKRFDSEQAGAKERDIYLKRWTTAEEHINGETATVGTPHFVNGQQSIWGGFELRKVGDKWNIDLEASDIQHFWAGKYGIDQPAAEQRLKEISEITDNIEKGSYKDEQEAIAAANDAVTRAKARLEADIAAGRTTVVENKNGRTDPLAKTNFGDAKTWAESYRNAKFITRAEFLKRVGPVHLVIRERSGVSECVRNLDDIVRTSASAHGWTLASGPTDVEMVVDADIERTKITTTEYTNWGPSEQEGYQMAYTASVQVGFVTKANCRRGNKFVQLDVYPYRNWNAYWGSMGDWVNFEAAYAKAFREAVDGAFDAMAKMSDSDDPDDEGAWTNSLWPAAQNAEMQREFVSAMKVEPGASKPVFYGVTKFEFLVDLLEDAGKEFNVRSLQQSWNSELSRNGQEIDPSSDFRIRHEVGIWSPSGGLFARTDACYTDISAIRVWQKNVVFKFKGELRRAKVCFWSDLNSGTALRKDQSNTARDVVNQSIRSAAREFSSSR